MVVGECSGGEINVARGRVYIGVLGSSNVLGRKAMLCFQPTLLRPGEFEYLQASDGETDDCWARGTPGLIT